MENDDSSSSTPRKVEFRRRLNRDPDKGFGKLSTDGKVLVSSLRTALEESKLRIMRLRDENEKKDEIIEEERNFRQALEEKLEKYLVDLYDNPNVNAELHQRLPRAKKTGHLFQRKDDDQDSEHDAASESSDIDNKRIDDIRQKQMSDEMRMQSSAHDPKPDSENQLKDPNLDEVMTATMSVQQNSQNQGDVQSVANSNLNSTHQVMSRPFPPGIPPVSGNPQYLPYAPLLPYYQPQSLASNSMTSMASSSYLGLPVAANQQMSQATSQQNLSSNANPTHKPETHTASPRQIHHTQDQTRSISDTPVKVNHPISHVPGNEPGTMSHLNWNSLPAPVMGSEFISPIDRPDNVSHITRLLQEMSVLKMENKELKSELKENKRDLELLKMEVGQDDENRNTEAIAALIEEVKRAEKAGEMAVSQLIQSANEDRNVALHELDRLRLKASKRNVTLSSVSPTELSTVEDTEENELGDTSFCSDLDFVESEREESLLSSNRMKKLLERQKEITKQQMDSVISQRDEALDKVSRLQKKLSSLKLSTFPGATNQTLQAKLKITEKERDIAVGKLKLMSQDMNEVTLLYNLQKALLKDDVNVDSNKPPASKWTTNVDANDDNKTAAMLETLDKEKMKLKGKLKSLERENVEKDKRIEKLEELVLRQRKKLNTLCAGPLLMDD